MLAEQRMVGKPSGRPRPRRPTRGHQDACPWVDASDADFFSIVDLDDACGRDV
jgi:hypothetical protein